MSRVTPHRRPKRVDVSSGYFIQTALLVSLSTVLMLAAGTYWITQQAEATLDAQERENRNSLAIGLGLAVTESVALNDQGAIEARLILALSNQNLQEAVVTDRLGNVLAFVQATEKGPQPVFNQRTLSPLPPAGMTAQEEKAGELVYRRWQSIEVGIPLGWLRITTTDERNRTSVATLGQQILVLAILMAAAMLTAFGLILRRAYRVISANEFTLRQRNLLLQDAADTDALTQLANRPALMRALQGCIVHNQPAGSGFAVCFMDLDGFKPINDTHGHDIGDKVLKAVAQRIKSTARQGDFVARLGGDEFVLLVDNIDNASELGPVFSRLIRTISEPIGVGDLVVSVGLSIGASIFPRDGISAEMLLAHADQAMYHAKKAGGRQSALWERNVQLDQTEP